MNDQSDRSPVVPSAERAQSLYDDWLREKVAASLANANPNIPHMEIERRMAERIRRLRRTAVSWPKSGGAGP
ncbi:hypothetical protein [Stenotrophomonas maltophilia]|uniref:antitoxin PaaA2 family protein n=1 Tax=Stenotrophomonas maltophilia TaxID=40324 RepID=UPI003D2F5BE1